MVDERNKTKKFSLNSFERKVLVLSQSPTQIDDAHARKKTTFGLFAKLIEDRRPSVSTINGLHLFCNILLHTQISHFHHVIDKIYFFLFSTISLLCTVFVSQLSHIKNSWRVTFETIYRSKIFVTASEHFFFMPPEHRHKVKMAFKLICASLSNGSEQKQPFRPKKKENEREQTQR